MITEDYCSFELSKFLKEKGFKQEGCHKSYSMEGPVAPTHQMAMKWLRHKGIYIEIDVLGKTNIKYDFTILKLNECEIYSDDKIYTIYEEAVDAALKYCLMKII